MKYTGYILKCADGTYYTGLTTNHARRLKEHNKPSNYLAKKKNRSIKKHGNKFRAFDQSSG